MGSNFYPSGKSSKYSYTQRFTIVGNDTAGQAKANTAYPGLSGNEERLVTTKALDNLQALINGARAAELAFLKDTGINLDNPNASNIFRNINKIFNSKETFERGMRYMKSISARGEDSEKEQMYREVSRYFGTYLNKTLSTDLKKFLKADIVNMSPDQIKNLINDIIGNALVMTYERVKDFVDKDTGSIRGKFGKGESRGNEEEKQAINDMIQVVKELQSTGAFKEYGHLFNINADTLQQMTDRKDRRYKVVLNKNKFTGAQIDTNFGGNILELITSTVAAKIGNINISNKGLTITGMHTGQMNQMKADTMLFVAEGDVDTKSYLDLVDKEKYDSVRMQNIEAMDKYLNQLESNIKHVVMISDKNYSITADFGGFTAQSKMSLQDVGGMLGSFGVNNVKELIDYLANCGDAMVQGQVNGEVRTKLQTMIGYFLFDHLNVKVNGSVGPNVVNLLNVSGIYIPLSAFLEGVYNSIKNVMSNPSSLVSLTISLGGPTEGNVWTEETWESFRESHETQSFISYKILKDIGDFVSGL